MKLKKIRYLINPPLAMVRQSRFPTNTKEQHFPPRTSLIDIKRVGINGPVSMTKKLAGNQMVPDQQKYRGSVVFRHKQKTLEQPLVNHGIGHLQETGNIGPLHIVHIAICIGSVLHAVSVNTGHDLMQTFIDLPAGPVYLH